MDFEIEIGTDEQKKYIRDEIVLLLESNIENKNLVSKVIVAQNIGETINHLEKTKTCSARSDLNQEVVAKVIKNEKTNLIVLSARLYLDEFDKSSRYLYLLHELIHIKNNRPKQKDFSICGLLINDTNWLFDEFLAYYLSWSAILSIESLNSPYLESMYSHILSEYSQNIKKIDFYHAKIQEYKNETVSGKVGMNSRFKKIKRQINDFLLKSVIVTALELSKNKTLENVCKEYNLPVQLTTLLNDFYNKISQKPYWADSPLYLNSIYEFFSIYLDYDHFQENQIKLL